jgi:hypothetical protein
VIGFAGGAEGVAGALSCPYTANGIAIRQQAKKPAFLFIPAHLSGLMSVSRHHDFDAEDPVRPPAIYYTQPMPNCFGMLAKVLEQPSHRSPLNR